jgi:nitrite reductase/ring-hydroxylating ferredoxin subunit
LVLFDFGFLGKWILDFSLEDIFVPFDNQDYGYHFILDPSRIALLFQEDSIDFEKYFLGCNFTCGRDPDEYNEFLFVILKHFDTKRFIISESLYAERSNLLDEMFVIEHNGKKIEVQKYCPHMFADLEGIGFINKDDKFVCPLHGWKFDLNNNGECFSNKTICLKIKYIED